MKNKLNSYIQNPFFIYIKKLQYALFIMSILFLILSISCTIVDNDIGLKISYNYLFRYIFFSITDDVLILNGVSIFLFLQTICLIIFFFIALLLGLTILPMHLSEKEKIGIIQSPYNAFNNIFFSKILFGGVKCISTKLLDFRNKKLNIVADLYLLHFKFSGKLNGFMFLFFMLFITPFFVPLDDKKPYFQLLINFSKINISLFIFIEFVMFYFSKLLVKGNKNEF